MPITVRTQNRYNVTPSVSNLDGTQVNVNVGAENTDSTVVDINIKPYDKHEKYPGPYEIVPKAFDSQEFDTRLKVMLANLVVDSIPITTTEYAGGTFVDIAPITEGEIPPYDVPNVNRVDFGSNTLIDLSEDTITQEKIAYGKTAHLADGSQVTGTAAIWVDEPIKELNLPYWALDLDGQE